MSIRLAVSVEGQTEERFVKDLLAPHLILRNIHATAVLVSTGRNASGSKSKGGGINFDRVRNELTRLLPSYRDGFVTSLYDFYGFGGKLPGETAEALQERMTSALGNAPNLIAYVQRHEFEALLLSDAAVLADYFSEASLRAAVSKVVERAGSPEDVNDSPTTAPSKRLKKWTERLEPVRRYSKAIDGPLLAGRLTLPLIRAACPRFGAWLTRLEGLAKR